MNIRNLLIIPYLLAVVSVNAVRKVTIVNNTTKPVQVNLTIPEQTEAQIKLKKLNQAEPIRVKSQELLYKAICHNSIDEIKQAIQAGADVNYTKDGKSALILAVLLKRVEAIEYLLNNGAKANNTIIEYALKLGATKAAYLLVKKSGAGINAVYHGVNGQDSTLLQSAMHHGDLETVLMLVKRGAIITNDNNAHNCCCDDSNAYSFWYNLIVWFGCNMSCKDYCTQITYCPCSSAPSLNITPGESIIGQIALEIAQEIINHGYKVDDIWPETNIYSSDEGLRLFIKNGANPNHVFAMAGYNDSICTPLFQAIIQGSQSAIRILLDTGADINQKANPYPDQPAYTGMNTPLAFAINMGKADIVELLIERGAILE